MNKLKVKRLAVFIVLSLFMISILGGLTYAFFTGFAVSENERFGLKAGTMALTFSDGDNGINESIPFGSSITKKFVIENTGTVAASLSIDWKNLVNTYMNGSLSYNIKYSDTIDGTYTEILEESNVPTSNEPLNQTLISEVSVPAGETYYYNLTITLNNLSDKEQTSDLNANLSTEFDVGQAVPYRYYTLSIDPNRGVWEEYTSIQEYKLKHNDTKRIENPTRIGYIFDGWSKNGETSVIENKEFIMGIGSTYLKAKWKPKKITIEIETDGETREVETEYGERVDLGEPPDKEGHTFTGWSTNKGTIEGNTLIIDTEETDIKVTANYTPNNYKYIVYHKKQNTDGTSYTLVEADTENKEGTYGTTVTPNVKTYTGFTSPSQRSLTIQVDTDPPTKNILNYEYGRNRYTLTINTNGGTYTGNTSEEMYYEETKDLGVATKTGYNFTNWTVTDGTLNGNNFQMGLTNATATANYTPKEYSVTFNANGGTVDTLSKTVTYDSTYGDLPHATYPNITGDTFIGWFTEIDGGIEITPSTKVALTDNQTLYAHYKKFSVPEAVTAILNNQTPYGVNTTTPNFAKLAITDEGVFSTEDDYGTSYYFRGAVTNNYVKFGKNVSGQNMWWRIIRINGDGSLRIQYDGNKAYPNGESAIGEEDRFSHTGIVWNTNYNDNKYVGWMFGGAQKEASTSVEQAQRNETDSDIKKVVDEWYKLNIEDKGLTKYIENNLFCNDRTISLKAKEWWTEEGTENRGWKSVPTAYGAYGRALNQDGTSKTENINPKFLCSQTNDKFTVKGSSIGNKALDYPVGLITADEIITAGGLFNKANKYYYLYKNSSYWYWTFSPGHMRTNGFAAVFILMANGSLFHNSVNYNNGYDAIVPVINIKSNYVANMIGKGTMNDPYQMVE